METINNTAIKVAEREELHRTIWAIAEKLRGSVDSWDFKAYVMGIMFYRYLSENLADNINKTEREAGDEEFDYALLSDEDAEEIREEMVAANGFFILPSDLFWNVYKNAKNDENLNVTVKTALDNIADSAKGTASEGDFAGLFSDVDVNSNRLGASVIKRNANLRNLLDGIAQMKLSANQHSGIDAFGDAYEYLMNMYASQAGKSGGEFYTPQSVANLLARLAIGEKTEINKIYDPACGSGSLLLQANKVVGDRHVTDGYYGQEINMTTYNLCRINMFLHNINYTKFNIANDDTLMSPHLQEATPFDVIVSNPPYSVHWAGDSDATLINDPRFAPAGVLAPKSYADLAFVMHIVSYLSEVGTAAIVEFPGVLYRGGAEKKIRQYLVEHNFVDAIIQLPENLFFGTSIQTCILILKKNKTDNNITFVDASKEFVKVTNNNDMSEENIQAVYDYVMNKTDKDHVVKVATFDEIRENDFNLSVSTYVEPEDTREKIDIKVLNANIKAMVAKENELRDSIDAMIAEIEGE